MDEYQAALAQLRQAEQNFQYADDAHVEKAALELYSAQKRVDEIIRDMKGGKRNEDFCVCRQGV